VKNKKSWIIGIAILAAVVAFAIFRSQSNKAPQYFTAEIGPRGTVRSVVEATGTINAVTTVQVGSQVSGTISRLNADFNSEVKKGQVIAQIDASIFEGNLLQARADLENAKANAAAARANLEKARATAVQSRAEYNRTVALAKEGVLSQQQLELAKSNADSADASVNAAQAQVTQANAQVSQRAAAVQVATTNLNHTTIIAPVDGIVIARSVDVGQTVAASLSAPTLFTIAQDLTEMQVYTKTDESDIGRIRSGQPVSFKVDAFPSETFQGKVQQVRMNATVVQNVVTYDTVIEFKNPERKLFPGMTAYVTIPVATARDVIRVPNAALRFKPDLKTDELRALYAKYGIDTGNRRGPSDQTASAEGGDVALAAGKSGADQAAQAESPEGPAAARRGMNRGEQPGGGAEGGGFRNGGQRPGGRNAGQAVGGRSSGGPYSGTPRERVIQTAVVWTLNPDKTLRPVQVKVGITDLNVTELIEGDIKEGDQVITGSSSAGRPGGANNPLGQAAGGGRRR
jgi:HlyD family secretion protein